MRKSLILFRYQPEDRYSQLSEEEVDQLAEQLADQIRDQMTEQIPVVRVPTDFQVWSEEVEDSQIQPVNAQNIPVEKR